MTKDEIIAILQMQIKELKRDLSKVSYEISTRMLENAIEAKKQHLNELLYTPKKDNAL